MLERKFHLDVYITLQKYLLGCAFELSSMGIRVDPESLDRQLTISGCDDRRKLTSS